MLLKSFTVLRLGAGLALSVLAAGTALRAQTVPPAQEMPAPQSRPGYAALVTRQMASAHAQPIELLFVGDSILASWMRTSPEPSANLRLVWDRWYGGRHAFDMSIGGDRTQNVLWRLAQGEADGLHPRLVVLLIGTNDLGFHATPAQAVQGIAQVVTALHMRMPGAHILLLGILPRAPAWLSSEGGQVNAMLARISSQWSYVTFLDIGGVLLRGGAPDPSLYFNGPRRPLLHPNALGAERIAAAIESEVSRWLGDRSR